MHGHYYNKSTGGFTEQEYRGFTEHIEQEYRGFLTSWKIQTVERELKTVNLLDKTVTLNICISLSMVHALQFGFCKKPENPCIRYPVREVSHDLLFCCLRCHMTSSVV